MNPYSTELCHHGILGQRWGKKNGPPYPLGVGDHSASEKKAGWRKSLSDMSDDELRQKINRKNLERQYNYYSTKVGKSRKANDKLDVAKKGFRTAGTIANATSKGMELRNFKKLQDIKYDDKLTKKQKDEARRQLNKGKMISDTVGQTANITANEIQKQKRINLNKTDLSKITDAELKKRVNRLMLEAQYEDAYHVNKGKERVEAIMDTVGAVTSVAGTALSIALLIQNIRR